MNQKKINIKSVADEDRKVSKLKYPEMVPLKLVLKLSPIQIGLYYLQSKKISKKRLYRIDLQNLLLIGNAEKITQLIYSQHEAYFDPNVVPISQVYNIIDKILEIIQNELMNEDGNELTEENQEHELFY